MSERDERTPVVVGVGQLIQRDTDPRQALDPLAMLAETARRAARNAGPGDALLHALDTCGVVEVMGWQPQNAPGLLAETLGARPGHQLGTATGGESGLVLLNHVAERIAAGDVRAGLIAGCNNLATLIAARNENVHLDWPKGGDGEASLLGRTRWGTSDHEQKHGIRMPIHGYPLFENALRAHRDRTPEEHQRCLGRMMSRLSEVAAKNPYAWFPTARSPEELITLDPTNRLIAWPYPKYLNAVMATDQAAAVLITSLATARRLGVPEDRWVWWHAGARSEEPAWFLSERATFHESPALRAAGLSALAGAGIGIDDVDFFDLYSCFPVAVELACAELGIEEDDPRGLTVTGGLPYAGGPGNAYTLASLAAMVERLRERPGATGLLTGLGWYFTKHATSVLASAPPERPALDAPDVPLHGPLPVMEHAAGEGRVETYTVLFDRDGEPTQGIVIGRLEGGERFVANTPENPAELRTWVDAEGVGRSGRVTPGDGRNVFAPH